eukprot:s977_g9.t1
MDFAAWPLLIPGLGACLAWIVPLCAGSLRLAYQQARSSCKFDKICCFVYALLAGLGVAKQMSAAWTLNIVAASMMSMLAVAFLTFCYVARQKEAWSAQFAANRMPRSMFDSPSSPSRRRMPRPSPREKVLTEVAEAANKVRRRSVTEALHKPLGTLGTRFENAIVDSNVMPDVDHVHLTQKDFVWVQLFVGAPLMCGILFGLVHTFVRGWLQQRRWLTPTAVDPKRVAAQILLETPSLAMFFKCKRQVEGRTTALFAFTDIILINHRNELWYPQLITFDVDLKTKTLVKAAVDGDEVTASDAITLTYFMTAGGTHPRLHAYANFGVDTEATRASLRQGSIITVIFNHFGFEGTGRLFENLHRWGLINTRLLAAEAVGANATRPIPAHGHIRQLEDYSRAVRFAVSVRAAFFRAFRDAACQEPDSSYALVNPEALFVGSVMHSLDHFSVTSAVMDILWFDVNSPKFGIMAQVCRVVRGGVSSELPGLLITTKFRWSRDRLHQAVYRHASGIDAGLANEMEICICR